MTCALFSGASFVYGQGSVALNGGYALHYDQRDMVPTVWATLTEASFALPEFETVIHLGAGALMTFEGDKAMHASVTHPDPPLGFKHCVVSFYLVKQCHSYYVRNLGQRMMKDPKIDNKIRKDGFILLAKRKYTDTQLINSVKDYMTDDQIKANIEALRSVRLKLMK